jgi:hypothetical protein
MALEIKNVDAFHRGANLSIRLGDEKIYCVIRQHIENIVGQLNSTNDCKNYKEDYTLTIKLKNMFPTDVSEFVHGFFDIEAVADYFNIELTKDN